jgi:hypothetical protein
MAEFPNLAGVVTKDLVESIGTGKYSAAYVNWSRTHQLLRQHAPGWSVETKENAEGGILFSAPVGGYLQLRVAHSDGTVGPWVPQAVMDNRNKDIAFERIGARDITDTQRRGSCMCLAYTFGLAAELWAKMKLESGWGVSDEEGAAPAPKAGTKSPAPSTPAPAPVAAAAKESKSPAGATQATFREEALSKGIHTVAIDALVGIVEEKLGGDFAKGLEVLSSKSADELNAKYGPKEEPGGEAW